MSENNYIVYKHTNLINNKNYIGITKQSPKKRWKNGLGYSKNEKFFADIVKYGWNNFKHEIIESNLTENQAIEKEKFYIEKYDSVNHGYNVIYGSVGCHTRREESIKKQLETKALRYGSGKSLNYLGQTQKVRCKETDDVFFSIADARRWCGSSKVSLCCQGKRQHAGFHPELNFPVSWEYVDAKTQVTIYCEEPINNTNVQKHAQRARPIICIETNEEFCSGAEAQRKTGICSTNILRVCNGKRKTAGNLHWRYKN